MSIFALPAVFALLTKIWVYALARKSEHTSKTFLCLLGFFAIHNLSEFVVLAQFFKAGVTESVLLRLYYVALFFSLGYMCVFAMSVANQKKNIKYSFSILVIAFVLSLIVVFSDWIVAGSLSLGYTVTAVKGSYYFVFQFFVILGFLCIAYTLGRSYLTTFDIRIQLKCFYAMLALSPVIIMSLLVMLMMQMGFQYTGVVLLPFASTLVLLIVVKTEKDNDLIRIRNRLPFTARARAERKIIGIYRQHLDGDLGFHEARDEIEKIFIESALDRSANNKTLAAELLGLRRSTLYSIFGRLDMTDHKLND